MKHLFTVLLGVILISLFTPVIAQVGINTDGSDPDASSILDLKSDDKGLLIPRMTAAQRNSLPSPAEGLMVYQTDESDRGSGFYFYTGSEWGYLSKSSFTVADNLVIVKSVDDFPAPVGGVITLDNNKSYHINGSVNIGSNSITMGVSNTIFGIDKSDDQIIYTGSGSMINATNQDFTIRSITMVSVAPGSQVFNVTGTTCRIQLSDNIFANSNSIGTIGGGDLLIVDRNLFVGNSGGFEFTGGLEHLFVRDNIWENLSGTAVYIPSGTFGVMEYMGNHFHVFSGQKGLDISTDITFINGIVANNLFEGSGDYIAGIATSSLGWIFNSNTGVEDSDAYGFCRFRSNTTLTTISAKYPTYYKASGTNAGSNGERFDHSSVNNRLTYKGNRLIHAKFILNGNVAATSNNENILIAIFKNGTTLIEEVEIRTFTSNQPYGMSLNGSVDMNKNDYLEVWVSNVTSTANVRIEDFQFRVEK